MAGAMRKMGIYLGLVEDDDARAAYGRYDARQSGYDDDVRDDDRRSDRYGYDEGYGEPGHPSAEYPSTEFSEEVPVEELAAPEPAPVLPRRSPRRLDLAPATGLGSPSAPRIGSAVASGPVAATATSTAVREPVAQPAPAPTTVKPNRITTLHPRTYNEARTIGERFREGLPVIMNLTEMDDADAKRLVDFAAGLSFGLHGSIERVTAKVFLISPQGTDVTAEDKARIREAGFFNQS